MSGIYSRYKRLSEDYELPLPSPADAHPHRSLGSAWCSRRFTKRSLVVLAVLLVCTYLRFWSVDTTPSDLRGLVADDALPPLYGEWHKEELELPQHDPELPPPEGREGKYINIANHIYGLSLVYSITSLPADICYDRPWLGKFPARSSLGFIRSL